MELCCHARSGNFISCSSYFVLVPKADWRILLNNIKITANWGEPTDLIDEPDDELVSFKL